MKIPPHQQVAIDFLRTHINAFLADDMGLGKTASSLLALRPQESAIVVCPASVKSVWVDECNKFTPYREAVVIDGELLKYEEHYPSPGQLFVVGYNNLPTPDVNKWVDRVPDRKFLMFQKRNASPQLNLLGLPKQGTYVNPFGAITPKKTEPKPEVPMVDKKRKEVLSYLKTPRRATVAIFDEAHMVKNFSSQRTEASHALAKSVSRRWALTGTPMLGQWMEIWNLLCLLDLQWSVFGTFDNFLRLCHGSRRPFGGFHWGKSPKSEKIQDALSTVMLRRMKEEVFKDLPEKTYQAHYVPTPPSLNQSFPDLFIEELRIPNLAPVRKALANYKYEQAIDLIETFEEANEPIILFSAHLGPVLQASRRRGWQCIHGDVPLADRKKAVEAFQAGKLKGIAATIAAAGVGLTLTRSAHVIRIDRDWTPALNQQAEDRAYRWGQVRGVVIHDIETDHPVDVHLRKINQIKTDRIQPVFGGRA